MIIFISIITYIISCLGMYLWIKIAHSKGGIFEHCKLDNRDIFFTFFPIINTLFMFLFWILKSPKKSNKYLDKFFNVKR